MQVSYERCQFTCNPLLVVKIIGVGCKGNGRLRLAMPSATGGLRIDWWIKLEISMVAFTIEETMAVPLGKVCQTNSRSPTMKEDQLQGNARFWSAWKNFALVGGGGESTCRVLHSKLLEGIPRTRGCWCHCMTLTFNFAFE